MTDGLTSSQLAALRVVQHITAEGDGLLVSTSAVLLRTDQSYRNLGRNLDALVASRHLREWIPDRYRLTPRGERAIAEAAPTGAP